MKKKEERKLQTEFDITDDNFEIYKKLYDKKTVSLGGGIGTIIGGLLFMTGIAATDAIIILNTQTIVEALSLAVFCGLIELGICILPAIVGHKISINKFKKKYPNINTDVDVKSLEKALTKYNELSKLKDMEEKKDHFLTLHSDEYNKMTTEEKMDSLNKEIEYLGQVMIEEKYRDDSTKNSAKVLKKTYNPNSK